MEHTNDCPCGAPRRGRQHAYGKIVALADLQAVLRPGDHVCLEGHNQKQADLLASALAAVDVSKVHDLHMVQSGVVLPEHLDVFERGVAKKLDYSYSATTAYPNIPTRGFRTLQGVRGWPASSTE